MLGGAAAVVKWIGKYHPGQSIPGIKGDEPDQSICRLDISGVGRGIALIFIISALALWITSLYTISNPRIRNLEDAIPDEPDEIEDVLGDDEKQPVMQTSS